MADPMQEPQNVNPEAQTEGQPTGPPGGPPPEPEPGQAPAAPAEGAPGEPGEGRGEERTPGTGDGEPPAKVEIPEDFDSKAFLAGRTGGDMSPEAAGAALYKQRRALGEKGSELQQLRQEVSQLRQSMAAQPTERPAAAQEQPGDVYDRAIEEVEQSIGPRPDPDEEPEKARRWDAHVNASVTRVTMNDYNQSAMSDYRGQQVAAQFMENMVPQELHHDFVMQANQLLGEKFPRSDLSWELLETLYLGLNYDQAIRSAYEKGARTYADQVVRASTAGVPVAGGAGGGSSPPAEGTLTREELNRRAEAGEISPEEFDKELRSLKAREG